jgi:hypothetical protein
MVEQVMAVMNACSDHSLMRECAYVLANPWSMAAKVTEEVALQVLKEGVIEALVGLLQPSMSAKVSYGGSGSFSLQNIIGTVDQGTVLCWLSSCFITLFRLWFDLHDE